GTSFSGANIQRNTNGVPNSQTSIGVSVDTDTGNGSNFGQWSLSAPHVAPTVNVQNVSVAENASIAASSLITSISNPSGDSITQYGFYDSGAGAGHFTLGTTIEPSGQWIDVSTSQLSSLHYVGGPLPAGETLYVEVYDATTG